MLRKLTTILFIIGALSCPSWSYATSHTKGVNENRNRRSKSSPYKMYAILGTTLVTIATMGYLIMYSGTSQAVENEENSLNQNPSGNDQNLPGNDSSNNGTKNEEDSFGQNLSNFNENLPNNNVSDSKTESEEDKRLKELVQRAEDRVYPEDDAVCMGITLDDVNELYEQNKDRIMIKTEGDVGIDDSKMAAWVKTMEGKGYGDFGKEVQKKTQYITFNEFEKQIETMSEKVIEKINEQNDKGGTIVFVVPFTAQKSNTWVFLLFWRYLKDRIPKDGKYYFIGQKYTSDDYPVSRLIEELLKGKKYGLKKSSLFLCFDDMPYSGSQLKTQLMYVGRGYKKFFVVTPYITDRAIKALKEGGIETIDGTKIIEAIECKSINGKGIDIIYDAITAVIFEHKMADNESVPQSFYAFGVYPFDPDNKAEELKKYKPTSVLKGVTYSETEQAAIKKHHYEDDGKKKYVLDSGDELLPIKAFYKHLDPNNDEVGYYFKDQLVWKSRGIFQSMCAIKSEKNNSV